MAKKIQITRVEIPEHMTLNEVLDMLRYAGLLRSNVKGFPRVIEYETPISGLALTRWGSFGATAEARIV